MTSSWMHNYYSYSERERKIGIESRYDSESVSYYL